MVFFPEPQEVDSWRNEMHQYEKGKRTKKPFGKSLPHVAYVTYSEVKLREAQYNPILQEAEPAIDRQKRQKEEWKAAKVAAQQAKVQRPYDIINLYGEETKQEKIIRKLGPIRNAYNVINNQRIPDFYFDNRDVKLLPEKEKKLIHTHQKEYDIVTGIFKQDHERRQEDEIKRKDEETLKKYWQTHDYDPVMGHYYDRHKDEEFQHKMKHPDPSPPRKLPPSYQQREPFIADPTKPLPDSLQLLDQKREAAKRRFKMKYAVENQYEQRNQDSQAKKETVIKERVHYGRVLDEKAKQFDIITNGNYPAQRAEVLFGKKPPVESWDELARQVAKQTAATRLNIRSSGFSKSVY